MPQTAANFLGGATSGCVSTLLLQPLDVVKTRLQVLPHHLPAPVAGGSHALTLSAPSARPGIAETARRIVRHDSPAGLWRGVTPTLMRNSLGVGCYFVTLNHLSTLLAAPDGSLTDSATLVAGASARSLAVLILCPLSVVKTRLELVEYAARYRGVADALAQIARHEGVRGLYSGLVPAIVRDAPYSALFFLTYLRTKAALNGALGLSAGPSSIVTRAAGSGGGSGGGGSGGGGVAAPASDEDAAAARRAKALGRGVNFAAGAVGGGLATILTQPQDVVKTRMQVRSSSRAVAAAAAHGAGPVAAEMARKRPGGVSETVRAVFKEEGVLGFFRGASPRFLKRILGSAITWMIYEESVRAYASVFPATADPAQQQQQPSAPRDPPAPEPKPDAPPPAAEAAEAATGAKAAPR